MKKNTRNLLITTILFTLLSILLIYIFSQDEYRKSPGSGGGYGALAVCIYFYYKIWKTHKNEKERNELEIELSDERLLGIQQRAGYITFIITICEILILAYILTFLHYNTIAFLFICVGFITIIIYFISYAILKRLH